MIQPTIGRQVWYFTGTEPSISSNALSDQPFAATVVHVNDDTTINVAVLDHFGKSHFVKNCTLTQEDGEVFPTTEGHCEWMPYQKQQADAVSLTSAPGGFKRIVLDDPYPEATEPEVTPVVL